MHSNISYQHMMFHSKSILMFYLYSKNIDSGIINQNISYHSLYILHQIMLLYMYFIHLYIINLYLRILGIIHMNQQLSIFELMNPNNSSFHSHHINKIIKSYIHHIIQFQHIINHLKYISLKLINNLHLF